MAYKRRNMRHVKILTQEDLEAWPKYASKSEWCRILHVAEETWRYAVKDGRLMVDTDGYRVSTSKKEVLKWYAPSLYREVYGEEQEKEKVV